LGFKPTPNKLAVSVVADRVSQSFVIIGISIVLYALPQRGCIKSLAMQFIEVGYRGSNSVMFDFEIPHSFKVKHDLFRISVGA
jgi:hypothetical protein